MSSGLDAKHAMRNKNWSLEQVPGRRIGAARSLRLRAGRLAQRSAARRRARPARARRRCARRRPCSTRSLAFVGQVGFLMHLARAVDCRAVIVYGGRETPAQSGYPCNENLYSRGALLALLAAEHLPVRSHVPRADRACADVIDALDAAGGARRRDAGGGHRHDHRRADRAECRSATSTRSRRTSSRGRRCTSDGRARPIPASVEARRRPSRRAASSGQRRAAPRRAEARRGAATCLDGERVVADVDYALRDVEERGADHAPPTVDVTGSPAGRRNVYGLVACPDPGRARRLPRRAGRAAARGWHSAADHDLEGARAAPVSGSGAGSRGAGEPVTIGESVEAAR